MLKRLAALCAALVLNPLVALADDYPTRPVTVIVPYAPGGTTDLVARLVLKRMEAEVNQSFVIENRAGASGAIGATLVSQAEPDGYTLMFDNIGILTMNEHLIKELSYNPQEDFSMIGMVIKSHQAVAVGPTVEAKTIEEFFQQIKAEPGKFRHGSGGIGTGVHVFTEYMKSAGDLNIEHIPYKSSGIALTGLMSGEIDMSLEGSSNVLPHVQAGRLRVLAVTSAERDPQYPDVPTLAESVLPGFTITAWSSLSAPSGTPTEIIQKLNRALNAALSDEELLKQLSGYGLTPFPTTPEEAANFINEQRELWGKIIKEAKIEGQ